MTETSQSGSPRQDADDPRIDELLLRWEDERGAGRPPSADELCRDCPELRDEVARRIAALERMAPLLDTVDQRRGASTVDPDKGVAGTQVYAVSTGKYPPIPGYEILGELGRGGMGVVFKARQTKLNRLVAIKTVLTGAHAGARERARFHAEAEAVARLQHPNIVQIFEINDFEGHPYFSMEFVEGQSLSERLHGQPIAAEQAALIIETLARAIHYAHQRGVVHRDLKPANVLMSGGRDAPLEDCSPKITDFGLARHLEDDARLTRTGTVLGTPCYMAPEQVESRLEDIGPLTDVYGLGALLYEMLTGRPPFVGRTDFDTMQKVVSTPPEAPSLVHPDAPAELEAICLRCLEKSPLDRYSSAEELADDLLRYLGGEPTQSGARRSGVRAAALAGVRSRIKSAARPDAQRRTTRRALLAGLGGGVLLALAAWWVFDREHHQPAGGRGQQAAGGPAAVPGLAGPPIKVGVLGSLTGTMRLTEEPVIETTLMAIEQLNARGGVLGRPVVPVVVDGASRAETFVARAEQLLLDDGVEFVFACGRSSTRRSMLPVIEKHDGLLFYSVESEGVEDSSNVVHTGAAPNQHLLPAVKWAYAAGGKRKFFLVGSDYIYPHVANEILKDEIKSLGGEVVGEEYLPLGGTKFDPVVKKIIAAQPDVILNTINGDSNVAFFRELREDGVTPDRIPVISFSISALELVSLDLDAVEGDLVAGNYFQVLDNPENKQFLEMLAKRFGQFPVASDAMESAYVAVNLWAQAVAKAGTIDVDAVRDALRGQAFVGPGGQVVMNPELLNTSKFTRIAQVTPEGRFKIVFTSPEPIEPQPFPASRTREQWEKLVQDLYQRWGNSWFNPER